MLVFTFSSMVGAMDLDPALYSLHSLHRGWATVAHRQELQQEMIKHHGMGSSDSFWPYITSLVVASSPVVEGLANAVQAVSFSSTSSTVSPCHSA